MQVAWVVEGRGVHSGRRLFWMTLLLAASCWGQENETARVLDSASGTATNLKLQTIIAAGQPNPVGVTQSAQFRNHSGFLRAFTLFPASDADADGVSDEDDPDDDNDGLSDLGEVTGSNFVPVTVTDLFAPDTDQDGSPDGDEAEAGTNPLDPTNLLAITGIEYVGGTIIVSWKARDGKQYELQAASSVAQLGLAPSVAGAVTAVGGVPPWFETVAAGTNVLSGTNLFYRVRLLE